MQSNAVTIPNPENFFSRVYMFTYIYIYHWYGLLDLFHVHVVQTFACGFLSD